MASIAREVRTQRVRSERVQPGTAAREKGRSSMFLIYSFAASKEGNAFKNSKLLTGTELCQVLSDDGCFKTQSCVVQLSDSGICRTH